MACEYERWKSVKNSRWYWHLLDENNSICAEGGGGAGHATAQDCVDEMNRMQSCVGGTRGLTVHTISDPNA